MVEHPAVNRRVAGSSPARGASYQSQNRAGGCRLETGLGHSLGHRIVLAAISSARSASTPCARWNVPLAGAGVRVAEDGGDLERGEAELGGARARGVAELVEPDLAGDACVLRGLLEPAEHVRPVDRPARGRGEHEVSRLGVRGPCFVVEQGLPQLGGHRASPRPAFQRRPARAGPLPVDDEHRLVEVAPIPGQREHPWRRAPVRTADDKCPAGTSRSPRPACPAVTPAPALAGYDSARNRPTPRQTLKHTAGA